MLTPAQRQQIIKRLESLRDELEKYVSDRNLLRELPPELLSAVKKEPAIAPITSSGIERIAPIFMRLNWSITLFKDPNFPPDHVEQHTVDHQSAPLPPAPQPDSPVTSTAPPTNPPAMPPDDSLDFGPFKPKGMN